LSIKKLQQRSAANTAANNGPCPMNQFSPLGGEYYALIKMVSFDDKFNKFVAWHLFSVI